MTLQPDPTLSAQLFALAERLLACLAPLSDRGAAPEGGEMPPALALVLRCCAGLMREAWISTRSEATPPAPPDRRPFARFLSCLAEGGGGPGGRERLAAFWHQEAEAGLWPSPCLDGVFAATHSAVTAATTLPPLPDRALPLLAALAAANWGRVDPLLLGSLVEQATPPRPRHRQGRHLTPRPLVEQLVDRVVIEALTGEETGLGRSSPTDGAVTVLDPACGCGNFLLVAAERLGTWLQARPPERLAALSPAARADPLCTRILPQRLLGLEIDPQQVAVARLVLWLGLGRLGWLWRGGVPLPAPPPWPEGLCCCDALLDWRQVGPLRQSDGTWRRHWAAGTVRGLRQGEAGAPIPGPGARAGLVLGYQPPRPTAWPDADFILGNPPFLGGRRVRDCLGPGYSEALREAYPEVPAGADLALYWWHRAALLLAQPGSRPSGNPLCRFGFVTSNSLGQPQSRKLLARHLEAPGGSARLCHYLPDLPWRERGPDRAAVRIALSVVGRCKDAETASRAWAPRPPRSPVPAASLAASLQPLPANKGRCFQGLKLVGEGFRLAPAERQVLLAEAVEAIKATEATEAVEAGPAEAAARLPRYWIGRDLVQHPQERYVIDLSGLSLAEAEAAHPSLVAHLRRTVAPMRARNNDARIRAQWWLFGRPRPELRRALAGLDRYIVTCEVAKHRVFTFLPWPGHLVDGSIIAIASADAALLAVLSSRPHRLWSRAVGGTLTDRPRYQIASAFEAFPFPPLTPLQEARLRRLGDALERQRRALCRSDPCLTLTALYNALDHDILTQGSRIQGSRLRRLSLLHRLIDRAVIQAYGWPETLSDEAVLEALYRAHHQAHHQAHH